MQETDLYDAAAAQMVSERVPAGVVSLPIDQVIPNPGQPRRVFEERALQEMCASIRELGILQPIIVREVGKHRYELVAGERRWRAAGMAGLSAIPAVIRTLEDGEMLEASLTENLQREDLSPMEEAVIFQRMVRELGYSIRRLADRLGKGKGYVEDRLRLTRMPLDLQDLVSGRPDTLTHAREIEKVTDPDLRARLITMATEGRPLADLRRQIARVDVRAESPVGGGEIGSAPSPPRVSPLIATCRELRMRIETASIPADSDPRAVLRGELLATASALAGLLVQIED